MDIHTYVSTYLGPYVRTYMLLLISMLWHRQAIFESKGDKLSSSAECRIQTQRVSETQSPADWMPADKPTELSRIKLKTLTRQPVPIISKHSAHLTPLPFGIRTWLWRYTYLLFQTWLLISWQHSHQPQCWKFLPVHQSEAHNFGGRPGTFYSFFFSFMFMIWDSRHEDLQLFDRVLNTDNRHFHSYTSPWKDYMKLYPIKGVFSCLLDNMLTKKKVQVELLSWLALPWSKEAGRHSIRMVITKLNKMDQLKFNVMSDSEKMEW